MIMIDNHIPQFKAVFETGKIGKDMPVLSLIGHMPRMNFSV